MSGYEGADRFNELLKAFHPVIDDAMKDARRDLVNKCASIAASYLEGGVFRDDLAEKIREIRITYRGIISLADDAVLLETILFLAAKK